MKSKLWQFAFLLFTAIGFSQSVTVSGKVFDSTSSLPLNGATISVKNAGLATTNSDGSFVISKIEVGSTLTFSFFGYTSEEYVVTKSETLSISLKQDCLKPYKSDDVGCEARKLLKSCVVFNLMRCCIYVCFGIEICCR